MYTKLFTSSVMLMAICIFTSCNNSSSIPSGKIDTLTQITEDESEAIQTAINSQLDSAISGTKALFSINGAAGDQEVFWKQVFSACFDNNSAAHNSIFTKRLLYMGPSNSKYLGTIIDSKGRTRRTLASILPASEFTKFSEIGATVNNCDLTKVKKITIDFIVGGGLAKAVDANLAAAFNSADSTIITGGSWRQDEFRIDDFLDYVNNDSMGDAIKKYRETLLENGNKVVTLVYKVDGFSAKAYLNKDISVDLAAKLSNTITIPGVDSASGSVKFSSSTKKEINISSTNSFYIFANVWEGKKLK